jgi:hypothetical protein
METTPTALCTAPDLSVHGGRQGGGFVGVALAMLVVTNRSATPCRVSGYPTVEILGQDGAALDVTHTAQAQVAGNSRALAPGQSVGLTFDWMNWCSGAPGPLRVALTPEGTTGSIVGPFDGPPGYDFVPGCRSASEPSTIGYFSRYASIVAGT